MSTPAAVHAPHGAEEVRASRLIDALYGIIARSHFPPVRDAEGMRRLLGLLRIALGMIVLVRTGLMAESARFYYGVAPAGWLGTPQSIFAVAECVLLVLFILGLATPLVTLALLVTYPALDALLQTPMLGTHIFLQLLVFMLLANAGTHHSLDAKLARRITQPLYGVFGIPDERRLTVYLFGLFAGYALLSVRALYYHAADPYWRGGDTLAVLIVSSYLSSIWQPMRQLQQAAPALLELASWVGTLGQTIFQLLMLPLVFWRIGMWFVVVWGALFIGISAAFLQLSSLPFVEAVLWIAVFARPAARPRAEGSALSTRRPGIIADAALAYMIVLGMAFLVHPPQLRRYFRAAGLVAPNVFNKTDLQMGEQWWVATRQGADALVPLNGTAGERLRYHRSDVLYFGNSLKWRRAMIGRDLVAEHAPGGTGRAQIVEVLRYDRRRHPGSDPWTYDVALYRSPLADVTLEPARRYAAELVLRFAVTISPFCTPTAAPPNNTADCQPVKRVRARRARVAE